MPSPRTLFTVLAVLVLAGALIAFGALAGPRDGAVITDRLGPEPNEAVDAYLARATESLSDDTSDPRFALVSFTTTLAPADALATVEGARVSELIHHVPIPRVQTPIVEVAVPDNADAALRSADAAAERIRSSGAATERAAAAAALSADRLSAGCACVAAALVRADATTLGEIARRDRVRAVQALPADAVYGRFAVMPLLPEQDRVVEPGPDDGVIPQR
ncbi:hypothetical protein OG921_22855 [Aldersonia sp. NBC_00410]|uniref:hypothetical protein n=1 Tax=Aldersonia sp. NBC_00410 TaxID=2975954 RepID=UPI00224D7818|nr:hypothetical protein [Aldersonia sp. NBC_00410]MCX5046015.1 hypothetical protein [Aldersonia sp. NBC_00410]